MVNIAVAVLPFGVTAFGDMLQADSAGVPLQLSVMTLVNALATGETVN